MLFRLNALRQLTQRVPRVAVSQTRGITYSKHVFSKMKPVSPSCIAHSHRTFSSSVESATEENQDTNDRKKDPHNIALLCQTIMDGRNDMLRLFIEKGVNVDVGSGSFSPIGVAILAENYEAMDILFENGIDYDHLMDQEHDLTPLSFAVYRDRFDVAEYLIKKGCSINTATTDGVTPLMIASAKGIVSLVNELLRAGAEIDSLSTTVGAAVDYASMYGQTDVVQILLGYGALVEERPPHGYNALQMAAARGHVEVVSVLHSEGIRATPNNQTNPAIMVAAEGDHVDVIELLVQQGENINARSQHNIGALDIAAAHGKVNALRVLLALGVDYTAVDNGGLTALHTACLHQQVQTAKILLESGIDVDSKTDAGYTALLISCFENNPKLVELLLKHGADPNVVYHSKPILSFVQDAGFDELARIIKSYGGSTEIKQV